MEYVNYAGQPVSLDSSLHARPKVTREAESFHKGWRVVGIPPGAMEEAERQHNDASKAGISKPWSEEAWLRKFKKVAVRSKPYEVLGAADTCKALAEKAGWARLELIEVKREVRAA